MVSGLFAVTTAFAAPLKYVVFHVLSKCNSRNYISLLCNVLRGGAIVTCQAVILCVEILSLLKQFFKNKSLEIDHHHHHHPDVTDWESTCRNKWDQN